MADLLLPLRRVPAAALIALAAAPAGAQTSRAVLQPLAGVHVAYERLGPAGNASPPGRFEGSLATPFGTLRTTVHAVPSGDQRFQRGDTSFEWATEVLEGLAQLRDLQAGGTVAAWGGRLDAGLTARTECDWTRIRTGQSLQLKQDFGSGNAAQALLASSRTAAGQGTRWDLELTQESGPARWNAGFEAADPAYVSATGGQEARAGVRVGTQWRLLPFTRLEARYSVQLRGDAERPASWVTLGTRFDLPRRLSLVTSVETDAREFHKASLTLAAPLEFR